MAVGVSRKETVQVSCAGSNWGGEVLNVEVLRAFVARLDEMGVAGFRWVEPIHGEGGRLSGLRVTLAESVTTGVEWQESPRA